jgi:hypothetical protein
LEIVFEEEKKALEDHLAAIDRKLQECAVCVDSYRVMYAHLGSLREKLVQLDGHPSPLPVALPADELDNVIEWRLQELKLEGKISGDRP